MTKKNLQPLQNPGDELKSDEQLNAEQAGDTQSESAFDDGSAARIAELETTIAQQEALINHLQDKLQAVETVPSVPETLPEKRLIGEDWSSKTAAEAKAAGVTRTVLCRDGYYVPG